MRINQSSNLMRQQVKKILKNLIENQTPLNINDGYTGDFYFLNPVFLKKFDFPQGTKPTLTEVTLYFGAYPTDKNILFRIVVTGSDILDIYMNEKTLVFGNTSLHSEIVVSFEINEYKKNFNEPKTLTSGNELLDNMLNHGKISTQDFMSFAGVPKDIKYQITYSDLSELIKNFPVYTVVYVDLDNMSNIDILHTNGGTFNEAVKVVLEDIKANEERTASELVACETLLNKKMAITSGKKFYRIIEKK